MSHQSGIRANEELRGFFSHCKDGKIRLVKISIKDEELVVSQQESVKGDWEKDYGKHVPKCLEENRPCYLLFRMDSQSSGYDWLLLSYAPDSASIREKMLYAATRATLKAQFGQQYIRHEYHVATREDAGLEQFKAYLAGKDGPGPMTRVEEELFAVRGEERVAQEKARAATTLATQTLRGVAFPVDQEAQEKIGNLRDGLLNYVQLSVDTLNEAIKLERAETLGVRDLRAVIPRNKPRYHFYAFKHTYEGQPFNSVVFVYSMPSNGCTVKERMLYSSCKGPFLDTVERFLDLNIDRKIEIDSTEELGEEYLMDVVHPKINLNQPLFSKPKPPGGRGLPRITRPVPGK